MKLNTDKHYRKFNEANSLKYMISCDWLQVHVKNHIDFGEKNTLRYLVNRSGQTKVFKDVYDITDFNKNHVASYATNSNACILEKGHGILKFSNQVLYTKNNLCDFVTMFLKELNFTFIGITRLDIAYDFHSFNNRRNPHSFVKSFLNGEVLKVMRSQFRVAGEHNKTNVFNWLYFGSHKSEVSYKIYNKTAEQNAIARKAWIWDKWKKKSGLNVDKPIWRIEFTVNSTQSKFCNDFTSCEFHSLDILNHLHALFSGLFNHYFRFVERDKNITRKDRMKAVDLLTFDAAFIPYQIERRKINNEQKQSGRTQKILINQLLKHHAELRDVDLDFEFASSEMIKKLINIYGLEDWAKQKNIPVYSTDFIYPVPNKNYVHYTDDLAEIKEVNREDQERFLKNFIFKTKTQKYAVK